MYVHKTVLSGWVCEKSSIRGNETNLNELFFLKSSTSYLLKVPSYFCFHFYAVLSCVGVLSLTSQHHFIPVIWKVSFQLHYHSLTYLLTIGIASHANRVTSCSSTSKSKEIASLSTTLSDAFCFTRSSIVHIFYNHHSWHNWQCGNSTITIPKDPRLQYNKGVEGGIMYYSPSTHRHDTKDLLIEINIIFSVIICINWNKHNFHYS